MHGNTDFFSMPPVSLVCALSSFTFIVVRGTYAPIAIGVGKFKLYYYYNNNKLYIMYNIRNGVAQFGPKGQESRTSWALHFPSNYD